MKMQDLKVKKVVRYRQPLTDLDTSTEQIEQTTEMVSDGDWRSPALSDSDVIESTDLLNVQPAQRVEFR